MERVAVSVIIPIYDAEKYLKQCLESVINQTLENIEIILINDGSKDSSEKICMQYAMVDDRIKYVYKENEGLAAARQDGIDLATGEYVGFVDSDDWVERDMFEKLYIHGINNNADVVLCNCFEYDEKKDYIKLEPGSYNRNEIIKDILPKTIISIDEKGSRSNIRWSNCLRIYSKKVIEENNICFDRRFRRTQDLPFTYDAMLHASGFYFTNEFLYHNRQDAGSLSRGYTKNMWELIKPVIEHIIISTDNKKELNLEGLLASTAFFLMMDSILNEFKSDAPNVFDKIRHIETIVQDDICRKTVKKLDYKRLNSYYRKVFYNNMKKENAIMLIINYYYYRSKLKRRVIMPILNFLTENIIYTTLRNKMRKK